MLGEETIAGILASLGLTKIESDTYIFLARHGVLKCREISKGMKRHTAQVYRALKALQSKGLVESTLESPSRFTAVPFEKVIDLSIKIKHDEATAIEQEKEKVLSYWKHFGLPMKELSLERFLVIEGNNKIYSKIAQMAKETRRQFSAISSIQGIFRADQFGIFDTAFDHPHRSEIEFRFLTELPKENVSQLESFLETVSNSRLNLKVRNSSIGKLSPRLVVKDDEELLFFITPKSEPQTSSKDDVCFWTNCRALVKAFSSIFEDSWRNSIDINKKLVTPGSPGADGQATNTLRVISKRYERACSLAQQNLTILTSAQGIIELSQNKERLEKAVKDGITVRILAPITKENLETAIQLAKLCEVKHVSANYDVETILVDDSVVLQLRNKEVGSTSKTQNLVYSNNSEYVGMLKNGLNEIWSRSNLPSTFTLEQLIPYGPSSFHLSESLSEKFYAWQIIDVAPPNLVNEKNISDKCINAKKIVCKDHSKEISRAYGSGGLALIHPQEYLDLPDMIIQCSKIDEQSSFGEEDWMTVSLPDEDKNRRKYHTAAAVGDNPASRGLVEALYSNTNIRTSNKDETMHSKVNIQTLKKDEIQIRVHGNTLLAAWTVPIQLAHPKYVLPPACVVIEGVGQVKTRAFVQNSPSGFRHEFEQNYFDAFVTFIHQDSQYSGPSTDGAFCRDVITTNYPPGSYR